MNVGIHHKVPMAEYLKLKYFSGSLAHILLTESPHHARYAMEHVSDDPSDGADMGIAIHDALLEGVDRIHAVAADNWRTKAAREERDNARSMGMIPMLEHKVEAVLGAVNAIKSRIAQTELAGCFDSGSPEVTGIWQEDNITCKLRCDWLNDKYHVSLKTTPGSANPNTWIRRQLGPMGYADSLVFYERGLRSLGKNVEHRLLVVEQSPPYGCSVIGLTAAMEDYCASRIDRAIRQWQRCLSKNDFPSYSPKTEFADLLPWDLAEEEKRRQLESDLGDQA